MTAREAAVISLGRVIDGGKYSNLESDAVIKKYGFSEQDGAFYTRLLYGTVEKLVTIDFYLSSFSKKPIEKIEKNVLAVLRTGVYQLLYMDGIPDSAACNESVKLVKKLSHKGSDGFVNGILRNIARNRGSLPVPDEKHRLSVEYSMPQNIVDVFIRDYGREKAEEILSALSKAPGITLRVNTLKTDTERLLEETGGIRTPISGHGIITNGLGREKLSDLIESGKAFVQDESSQLCAEAVGAESGELVIDTCACPGGKSFSMAIGMKNEGRIMSFDVHVSKLPLIEKEAKKLGITIIETAECDGTKGNAEFFGKADRVLCDAPCSGLGVISKKPELRFKAAEDIDSLPALQLEILKTSSKYPKKGGTLVYSTCTLNKKENGEVVEKFLAEAPDFGLVSEKTFFPTEDSDGFYCAVMKRK